MHDPVTTVRKTLLRRCRMLRVSIRASERRSFRLRTLDGIDTSRTYRRDLRSELAECTRELLLWIA